MLSLAYFLLKVTICSAVLFGYYWFFLRNKIFHSYNRFYLLMIVVLSVTLPLMKINITHRAAEPKTNIIKMLQVVTINDDDADAVITVPKQESISVTAVTGIAYALVCTVLFLMMVQMLLKIAAMIRKNKVLQIEDIRFVSTPNAKGTPFSFFKYIFWNEQIDLHSPSGERIFRHEVAHVKEGHSLDKIFINTVLIVCWCNPVFWLIRKELSMIHEFTADRRAVENGDTAAFAAMILAAAYPQQRISVTNHFFYSPIKRRLMMLTKNQNPKVNYLSRLIVLPLAVLVFAAFSLKAKTIGETKSNSLTGLIQSFTNNDPEENTAVKNTPEKLFLSEKKLRVVIDAGHGGADKGAVAADGTLEKDLTLQLAMLIKNMNSNPNLEIILTRDKDVYQSPKDKAAFSNEQVADLFISLHTDNSENKNEATKSGMSVFVARQGFTNTEASKLFASAIIGRFENKYKISVQKAPLQRAAGTLVLQAAQSPAVLIEAGYISNEKDRQYLKSAEGQKTFAANILNALEDYAAGKYIMPVVQKNNADTPPPAGSAYRLQIKKISADSAIDASESMTFQGNVRLSKSTSLFTGKNDPLIIIDGNISDLKKLDALDPNLLNKVIILKDKSAFTKYGEQAKDGALEIYTKEYHGNPDNTNLKFQTTENKPVFIDPVFRIGNLTANNVSADIFKSQTQATVTDNYILVEATVYFSGEGFSNPGMAKLTGSDLAPLKNFINRCGPGASVTFDNVKVTGSKGTISIEGKTYRLK